MTESFESGCALAGYVQTVRGAIAPGEFGFALIHEHVMVDFIGAAETGPHRWDVDEVTLTMLPYFEQARERGISGFVDCTPAYIGRDVHLLRRLSELSGIHILTNTGYYGAGGDRYLPPHAFTESAEDLAGRWIREWREGIDGTDVRPGFIKIGVDPAGSEGLMEVDAKLVHAAAMAHRETGLVVVSHTAQGAAGLAQVAIFESEGVDPRHLILAHSDAEPDLTWHFRAAGRGAWISYDGIDARPIEEHLRLVPAMLERHPDRLLLSMDSGWYNVGEPAGGTIRDYNALTDEFLPALLALGVGAEAIGQVTVANPARAFSVEAERGV